MVEQFHLQDEELQGLPLKGVWVWHPIGGQSSVGWDILPIFLLRLGSSHLMWIASLASCVIWEGSLSMMLKSEMEGRGWWKSLQCLSMAKTFSRAKDEVMQLLKLVLENCVFTFQDKFFKQLHSAVKGSPCSPVVANIYMEYFENIALGPELPIPVKEWKRYVDDVFSMIPKGNWDRMLQYLNSIDPHIKFTIEQPNEEGGHPLPGHLPKTPKEKV